MTQAATTNAPAASAKLSSDGRTIMIRSRYSPEIVEFFHSLPNARWHRIQRVWTCDNSPATAVRLYESRLVDLCNALENAAHNHTYRLTRAHENENNHKQPPVRTTEAWRHQVAAYWFAEPLPAAMLAMDMGTGKSKVALDLVANWGCASVLILCPKSVLPVWRREMRRHSDSNTDLCVIEKGTVARKTAVAEQFCERNEQDGGLFVTVINYESAWRKPFCDRALGRNWDCVVLDESHRIKSAGSHVSRFAAKLGRQARRRLCLTGTPMPHSPLDVFGQYRFLDPGLYGTSLHRFRQRYAKQDNPFVPQQITGYRNEDELRKIFATIAFRVEADDVLDLPEASDHERTFALSPPARRAYDELEAELITEIQGGVITAANALVKLLRLQQITSGYLVHDETEETVEVDGGKAAVLAELLEDLGPDEPVVVFCRFVHDLQRVREICESLERRHGELSGRRNDLTDEGTMPDDVDVLAAQLQSGGLGIELVRARYAVYYSLPWSLGDYDQSRARIHRPGQDRHVHYYHLLAENSVDRYMMGALGKKREVVQGVLDALTGER